MRTPSPSTESAEMSLDQLSQAAAAVLGQEGTASAASAGNAARSPGDDSVEISPQSIVEALLFVGWPDNAPITSEQIANLLGDISPERIDEEVRQLNSRYAAQGCPYTIVSEGPGYRMVLRDDFDRLRDRFHRRLRAARLSPAAIEVLALVAYNEPLTAQEVSRLRGTPSGHILRQLVQRQLLRLERTTSKPSQPMYHTTRRFLQVFGLKELSDLPRSEDVARQ